MLSGSRGWRPSFLTFLQFLAFSLVAVLVSFLVFIFSLVFKVRSLYLFCMVLGLPVSGLPSWEWEPLSQGALMTVALAPPFPDRFSLTMA